MKPRNMKWSGPRSEALCMHRQLCNITMAILMVFFHSALFAQGKNTIKVSSIAISYNKTTNLVFPYAIKSVDRGSAAVLVQKAKGVENILQVKAGMENFPQTNLTVITADGALYSFIVDYKNEPSPLNLLLAEQQHKATHEFTPVPAAVNEATAQQEAGQIALAKPFLHRIRCNSFDVALQLSGIYIHDNIMYYHLKIENRSDIGYSIAALRFYIQDERKAKRTAVQEVDMQPVYVYGNTAEVAGATAQEIVVALPKFTIPDKKYLSVQVMEKNGGRHLHLRLSNRTLMKAKPSL